MLNQAGGTKTDTLVKLVLIFFISLLSFSVGTFVGKQFSDSQHKMANLEGDHGATEQVERSTASVDPHDLDIKPEDALTDADVAELAEEFINEEKDTMMELAKKGEHRSPADANHHDEHMKAGDSLHKGLKEVGNVAENIASGKPGYKDHAPVVKKKQVLPSQVAADAVGRYTVQLSSHNNSEEAEKVAEGYQTKGYNAFAIAADVKGKTWYRVSVGLFNDKLSANKYRQKLITDGVVKSAFVQKILKDRAPAHN